MVTKVKGAAHEYTESLLKGSVVPYVDNPLSVVGVANLLRPDPERILWFVVNLSANDMYLGFTEDTGSAKGILLSANGGFVSTAVIEDFELTTLPMYVYSLVADNQLYMVHVKRESRIREG